MGVRRCYRFVTGTQLAEEETGQGLARWARTGRWRQAPASRPQSLQQLPRWPPARAPAPPSPPLPPRARLRGGALLPLRWREAPHSMHVTPRLSRSTYLRSGVAPRLCQERTPGRSLTCHPRAPMHRPPHAMQHSVRHLTDFQARRQHQADLMRTRVSVACARQRSSLPEGDPPFLCCACGWQAQGQAQAQGAAPSKRVTAWRLRPGDSAPIIRYDVTCAAWALLCA